MNLLNHHPLLVLAAFASCLICVGLIILLRPLLQRYALARPNARSSHVVPTPQGAGIAVIAATLVVACIYALAAGEPVPLVLFGATIFIAVVGFAYGVRTVALLPRLLLQAAAVAAVVFSAPTELRVIPEIPLALERTGLMFAGLWFVNLVNFMDGLDLMTAAERNKPLRLLYVVNEDYAFLLNRLPMARAAREAGFEVHVATNVNKGRAAIEAEGFVVHPIPFRRGGLSPLVAIPAVLAIRRLETTIDPTIVHHSGLQCCVFGSLAALDRQVPTINAITGLGFVFTSSSLLSRLLKQTMVWLLPWLINRKHSHILVQNPDDRDALLELGASPARTTLIPGSGVDADRLQPLPEPDGPITIGFAGRLLADKGIRALVTAHDLLRSQGHNFNLTIAGNPDPANPASVSRDEVEGWTKRPGITWLGHIDDIATLWRDAHIAALPSHREGLPGALMEAAACGRPLVATDAPGCREICIGGQTGLLVGIEDPPALANAILTLAQSPDLRARFGAAARKLVEEKLSAHIIGRSIVELYNKLAREQPTALPAASPDPRIEMPG